MNLSQNIVETASFHLDEDILPGTPCLKTPYRNHGRHIVRNSAGLWICSFVFDRHFNDRNWLAVSLARTPESEGNNFHEPILLVGRADVTFRPLFEYNGDFLGTCCLLIDNQDKLRVIYEAPDGIYCLQANASGREPFASLSKSVAWTGPECLVEGMAQLGDTVLLADGRLALYYTRAGVLYEQVTGEKEIKIAEQGIHPSVFVEPDGTRHIAFELDRRIFYARTLDGKQWTDSQGRELPEMVAYFCSSWPSLGVSGNGKVVIAYQGEGKVDLKRDPLQYPALRPSGGSTVSYAVFDGKRWRIHDFLRSSEILLKRQPSLIAGGASKFFPMMEEFWRPSLAVDVHGVIWMFYLNPTRRHVYFSRFQGETFGEHYEARGPYDGLSRVMFLQKDAGRQSSMGFLTLVGNQMYFDHIEVPKYASNEKRRVVFLDNLEVDEAVGLEHCLGIWEKHPEPIFGFGVSGAAPEDNPVWCEAVKVKDGYELHYAAFGKLYCNIFCGRAFSRDGIQWDKRPPLDITGLTIDGRPFPGNFWRPIYLEDPEEKDPARRFKGLLGSYRHVKGIELRTWEVVASPDGVKWRRVGLEPVVLGDISVNFHLIRDPDDRDPRRRYKVFMLMGAAAGRCVCVFTSPDLIHWDRVCTLRANPENIISALAPWPTGPIAIDPDAGESPWEEEIHDAVAWRENGLLMFHYDAFYFGKNQHTQKALAVSRDGKHYWRIKRGAINMSHGNCGEWDSGRDRTSPPIRVDDELRLYFAGMPAGTFSDPDPDDPRDFCSRARLSDKNNLPNELRPWKIGLARLRPDGWGYFRLARDLPMGCLTTIPFEYRQGTLVVNGAGLGAGGLRVEFLKADDRTLAEGFGRNECQFSKTDNISSEVKWRSGKKLSPGKYRLRFVFEGWQSKLYAFGFE